MTLLPTRPTSRTHTQQGVLCLVGGAVCFHVLQTVQARRAHDLADAAHDCDNQSDSDVEYYTGSDDNDTHTADGTATLTDDRSGGGGAAAAGAARPASALAHTNASSSSSSRRRKPAAAASLQPVEQAGSATRLRKKRKALRRSGTPGTDFPEAPPAHWLARPPSLSTLDGAAAAAGAASDPSLYATDVTLSCSPLSYDAKGRFVGSFSSRPPSRSRSRSSMGGYGGGGGCGSGNAELFDCAANDSGSRLRSSRRLQAAELHVPPQGPQHGHQQQPSPVGSCSPHTSVANFASTTPASSWHQALAAAPSPSPSPGTAFGVITAAPALRGRGESAPPLSGGGGGSGSGRHSVVASRSPPPALPVLQQQDEVFSLSKF